MAKILMLTDRMEMGGAETHIAQLALELRKLGADVAVLSSGGGIADQLEREGITQYRMPLPKRRLLYLLRLIVTVRRLVRQEDFEILHAHSRIYALALRFCGRHRATRVVSVHAMFARNRLLSRLCYWGERTVAVSEDLRAYVCDGYRIPARRVRVIPNGIDTSRFYSTPAEGSAAPPRILFASRLDADCSYTAELLCRIAPVLQSRYPEIRIVIAGGGDQYDRIHAMAQEINTLLEHETVTLTGYVEDMPSLLRSCDVFVGVSRAAMEAAACGKAVILCGNEGYLGILKRSCFRDAALTNFCARGCPAPASKALADDLLTLLASPEQRAQYGRECAELISSHFSAAEMARQTLALYHESMPRKRDRFVTLAGYFGCGNMGDDAILSGLLEELERIAPSLGVFVLSGRPTKTERDTGVPCFLRHSPLSVLSSLLRSDALILGGGSLLQNLTSNRSLSYYLWLIRFALLLGRPVFLYATGIGPLLDRRACDKVERVLRRCRYIGLRDEASKRLLLELGVDAHLLHVGADTALFLSPPPLERAGAIRREHGITPDAALLCVALHGGAECREIRDMTVAAVRLICKRGNLTPVFLVLDAVQDRQATEGARASGGGQILRLREPTDAMAILDDARGLISMRLHGLILGAAVGTACIGIPADGRDQKISEFAKRVGADRILPEELSVAMLVERTEAAIRSHAQGRPILVDSVSEMRKKARKDLANIVEMIYNKKQ